MIRRSDGASQVQALVVIAIVTILLVRAYLAATGYPQIGGKTLHIAHALWGGALMVVAIFLLLSFTGRRVRIAAVGVGGVGFGLFLDEVGKFVTKSNDYFFAPSVAIMYVVLVLLILVNRAVQDSRGRSPQDDLIEGFARTGEALGGGVTALERSRIRGLLDSAAAGGVDSETVDDVVRLLDTVPTIPPGRFARWKGRVLPAERRWVVSARAAAAAAVLLTLFSLAGLISAAITISDDVGRGAGVAIASIGQFGGSALAFGLCLAAVILHLLHRGGLWPLRLLRSASIVTMLLTEVFDFVAEQFGALINVGVGLLTLAAFSYRLRDLSREAASEG